eukprot:1937936-Prymnesium_polylepis.2
MSMLHGRRSSGARDVPYADGGAADSALSSLAIDDWPLHSRNDLVRVAEARARPCGRQRLRWAGLQQAEKCFGLPEGCPFRETCRFWVRSNAR